MERNGKKQRKLPPSNVINKIEEIRIEKKEKIQDLCSGIISTTVYSKHKNNTHPRDLEYCVVEAMLHKLGYTIQLIRR